MKTALFILILVVSSGQAFALENSTAVCHYEGSRRIIEVLYSGEGDVPCVVQYTKDNSTESLWRAEVEVGYCEEKAAQFIKKHEDWGWQCQRETSPSSEQNNRL